MDWAKCDSRNSSSGLSMFFIEIDSEQSENAARLMYGILEDGSRIKVGKSDFFNSISNFFLTMDYQNRYHDIVGVVVRNIDYEGC